MYQPDRHESICAAACVSLAQVEPGLTQGDGFGGMLLRSVAVLLGVCVLAYLVLRFGLRRFSQRAAGLAGQGPGLQTLARLALDGQRSVAVVRAGSRVLLLGIGDGQISLLAELDPNEWMAATGKPAPASFGEVLKSRLGAVPPRPAPDPDVAKREDP